MPSGLPQRSNSFAFNQGLKIASLSVTFSDAHAVSLSGFNQGLKNVSLLSGFKQHTMIWSS